MGMAQQAAARFNHIVGHSRAVIAAAFAVAIGCAACAGSPARPTAPASAASAGCARSSVAGLDRRFVISIDPRIAAGVRQRTAVAYIPASYRPGHPAPLIMEFHGAGPDATAAGYERSSPLRKLADAKGFIDVFPQALRAPNGNLAWNAYGPVIWKVAEIPFVNKLLDAIAAAYCVDPARIYASGFSNGANMVNYVACRDAGRFAAVAPVAGPMFGQDDGPCAPGKPVAMLDIHSVNDPAVPYQGHPASGGYGFVLPSVWAWLAGWAALDRCSLAPPATALPDGTLVRIWPRCASRTSIAAYAAHSGHAWPLTLGGRPAAEVVWAFLSAHHR